MKFVSTLGVVLGAVASANAAISEGQPFGTEASGFAWIPDEQRYMDMPVHLGYGNTIHQDTGMLQQRFPNAPLPGLPDMYEFKNNWYYAPRDMNMWTYTGSPFQPYNNPLSPNYLQKPNEYAYDAFFNTVNLNSGKIFNNPQTPQPQFQAEYYQDEFYIRPRDPLMFRQNPLQPYNVPNSPLAKPNESTIPFGYAPNGLKYGFNEFTVGLLRDYIPNLSQWYTFPASSPLREYTAPVTVETAALSAYESLPYQDRN